MNEPIDLNARDEEDRRLRELQAKAAADYAEAQRQRDAESNRSPNHLGYPRTGSQQ